MTVQQHILPFKREEKRAYLKLLWRSRSNRLENGFDDFSRSFPSDLKRQQLLLQLLDRHLTAGSAFCDHLEDVHANRGMKSQKNLARGFCVLRIGLRDIPNDGHWPDEATSFRLVK